MLLLLVLCNVNKTEFHVENGIRCYWSRCLSWFYFVTVSHVHWDSNAVTFIIEMGMLEHFTRVTQW